MAMTNAERVGKGLELLRQGLVPFVERELEARLGKDWPGEVEQTLPNTQNLYKADQSINWDPQRLLQVMWNLWNSVFKRTLGQTERTFVSELRDVRNRWAHSEPFSTDDAYRALDSIERLLNAVSAGELTEEVDQMKTDLLRTQFQEKARRQTRRTSEVAVQGQPMAGLKPWREVVTPHPDVVSGNYLQAEFAADLHQVFRGTGSAEYRDPAQFFQRTYLTEGLRQLLKCGIQRLSRQATDPVVDLQTNFGGGKTHSLLALYHLFSGAKPEDLPGVEDILRELKLTGLPQARRAVLVGTRIEPGRVHAKDDGTEVHTLWGELAWQLGGKEGYALVAESDRHGTNPGDSLRRLFEKVAPALILIDEWVAFVRQLSGKDNLPAGSFEANLTFAQALTEVVREVPGMFLVASLPQSDIEVGGEAGKEALARLEHTFERIESPWRPASQDESYEIVRRRLFQPLDSPERYAQRDAVIREFIKLYQHNVQDFPANSREADYRRLMETAYPIHPELLDRLYTDWGSLERFQRTRGVLRLMAKVIHTLWVRNDAGLLIMPGNMPLDDAEAQGELTRYLEDNWRPVIERDVDGPHSLPLQIDRENPNLGRYSAVRRIARTLYMGSAPTFKTSQKGLDDRSIRLGCVQPGEAIPTFGDALRRMSDQATHLYVDGRRYWFSTQPSVNRLAQDRAAQVEQHEVWDEIKRRIRDEVRRAGRGREAVRVHAFPASGADVDDERDARLIMLGPEHPHTPRIPGSPARSQAANLLDQRGSGPRINRNTLVFMAADKNGLETLEKAIRLYLAWDAIWKEREVHNLDAFQSNQAQQKRGDADTSVQQRIPEAYKWLLVPTLSEPTSTTLEWADLPVNGQGALVDRALRKLIPDHLTTEFGGANLRLWLDRLLWRDKDHVAVKELADHFAQYLYLPRLRDTEVLLTAVQMAAGLPTWEQDAFALADGWDEEEKRYRGLRIGQGSGVSLDTLLVKPGVASAQLEQEAPPPPGPDSQEGTGSGTGGHSGQGGETRPPPQPSLPRRYHGTVELNAQRVSRDAGQIAEEVIQHLVGQVGAKVTVTLEIQAQLPEGATQDLVRTVSENSRTLRFWTFGFEEE